MLGHFSGVSKEFGSFLKPLYNPLLGGDYAVETSLPWGVTRGLRVLCQGNTSRMDEICPISSHFPAHPLPQDGFRGVQTKK